jgi:hypothetical protein
VPLAKVNGFILVWESLTGIISFPLPSKFDVEGFTLDLIP